MGEPTHEGDAELVGRALAGDCQAFAGLVERYRDAVCGVAYHYLGNAEDVQDAAQEAFVHAYLHLGQLRDAERFGPWLRRIAANACVDLQRRRGVPALSLEAMAERDVPAQPRDDVERVAARLAIREALAGLSEKTRLTLTLAYIDGYSHEEIAGFLEVPVGTVRSRLRLAKKQMREEAMGMLSDVLGESKPDPEFTRRVVDEALRRGWESAGAHQAGEAVRRFDEALAAVEQLEPGDEQRKLRMQALWAKGQASWNAIGRAEAVALYEEALAIAGELGLRPEQASMLQHIGVSYSNLGRPEKAEEHYRRALALYRELGDGLGEANCLLWLGSQRMYAGEPAAGRPYYEQALPLFEAAEVRDWTAVCYAMLDLLAEVGDELFTRLIAWSATCGVLQAGDGRATYAGQPGSGWSRGRDDVPAALYVKAILHQIGRLRTFLDTSVPVGGSWSGDAFSYTPQPIHAVMTVRSDSERVEVPAGAFEGCLLTELVSTETDEAAGTEHSRELNRKHLRGTRRAWFAPGVGLVRLHVRPAEGAEATIELRGYSIAGGSGYLPLAVGNEWSYGWAGIPPQFTAEELYRVLSNDGDLWYLEGYHYVAEG